MALYLPIVMNRTDRYILALMAPPFFASLLGAMALLLLERMLRVIALVGENNGAFAYVFDLLASLMPHYLGLALPAALFIACYIAFRRLAQTSELAAFSSLGRGLGRLAMPAMAATLVVTILSVIVHSHLQPYGRYAYRTGKFLLANASIAQALEAGAFVAFGDVTLLTEPSPGDGTGLGRIFVHERKDDGASRTITATGAALLESQGGDRTAIAFERGVMVDAPANGDRAVIQFDSFDWPVDRSALGKLRPRGLSEAELTWPELIRAFDAPPPSSTPERVAAEFHARVVRALSALAMPLLAIPLAVAGGRARTAAPVVVGVVCLLFYVQSLQVAEGLANLGRIPAGLSLWGLFAVFFGGSAALFWRAWRGVGFEAALWLPRPKALRRLKQAAPTP